MCLDKHAWIEKCGCEELKKIKELQKSLSDSWDRSKFKIDNAEMRYACLGDVWLYQKCTEQRPWSEFFKKITSENKNMETVKNKVFSKESRVLSGDEYEKESEGAQTSEIRSRYNLICKGCQ